MPKTTSTNHRNKIQLISQCPMTHTFNLLGNRWRPIILWKLIDGLQTTAELHRAIPIITRKMLYQDLKALITHGLVTKSASVSRKSIPSYHPTPLGKSLKSVLSAALKWAEQQQA
jgi:DNA-binding HxlR family transcriptional regulator